MAMPALLLASGAHQLEAAETLIQVGRFVVILFAARALAELMVRLRLPAIFAGAAMTATSNGITASVLGELKFLRTREGQTVIGAAVLDDILGTQSGVLGPLLEAAAGGKKV